MAALCTPSDTNFRVAVTAKEVAMTPDWHAMLQMNCFCEVG